MTLCYILVMVKGLGKYIHNLQCKSAVTVEYADCIYAEGRDYSSECPGYDTKPSDGKTPAVELWQM